MPIFSICKKPPPNGDREVFELYYQSEWLNRHSYFADHQKRFLESWSVVKQLPWSNAVVLDIGGVGPLASFAGKRFGSQLLSTSNDLRKRFPIESNVADIVLCTETIEHIKDLDSDAISDLEAFNYSGIKNMLAEIARIGKPGAKVFISTPNSSSMISLCKWLDCEPLMMDARHVRELTASDLIAQCEACGLETDEVKIVDTWTTKALEERVRPLVSALRALGYDVEHRADNILALFTVKK